jgi:hypothetical protein
MHDLPVNVSQLSAPALVTALQASVDKLFFISFKPENTLRARWYLVSVDSDMTTLDPSCGNPASTGRYYVHFYARHPADSNEFTDIDARWWPEWHEYSTGSDGILEYGARYMVYPSRIPDASKYIAWATTITLTDPHTRLIGPFNFQEPSLNPPGRSPTFRQYIPLCYWAQLAELCCSLGILPPRLTFLAPEPVSRKRPRKTP